MSDPNEPIGTRSPTAPGRLVVGASLLVAGLVAGWLVHAWISPPPPAAPVSAASRVDRSRPDIFLVTVGNVRADHLPTYRYERATAPFLVEVGRRGHVFTYASATSSWSLPSTMSLMTGLLPSHHGLESPPRAEGGRIELTALSESVPTLAQRMQSAGYQTYAVVANPLLLAESGLARGFDRFQNLGWARASRVQLAVERIAGPIRRREKPEPVFFWVHYGDPHDPYVQGSPLLNAWESGADEASAEQEEPRDPSERALRYSGIRMPELLRLPELAAGGAGLASLQALYDSEIRGVDDYVQLLYGDLGISDRDLVVVASDHGEEFREHGALGHGQNLYEETVRVPLMMSWPAVWTETDRVRERVSLVDVVPTLAEIAGVPVKPGEIPVGRSLVPLIEGREWIRDVPVVAELLRADGVRCRALYDGPSTKVLAAAAGDPVEVYDLVSDPKELTDLAGQKGAELGTLVGKLDAISPPQAAPPATVTIEASPPFLAEQIATLGPALPDPGACP